MARKLGQIVARGQSNWLVRVYLGRDAQTGKRKYHNQTIYGPFREAQRFLNLKLQQRDSGRVTRAAVLSLNQLLDQWLTTVVKARVRVRTFKDYETLLRLHIRPVLGSRLIAAMSQIDIQSLYAQMFARGLSAREHRVHQRGPEVSIPPSGSVEDARRRSLRWRRSAAHQAERDGGSQRRRMQAIPGGGGEIGVVSVARAGFDHRHAPERVPGAQVERYRLAALHRNVYPGRSGCEGGTVTDRMNQVLTWRAARRLPVGRSRRIDEALRLGPTQEWVYRVIHR
jgi:hypothetical protein